MDVVDCHGERRWVFRVEPGGEGLLVHEECQAREGAGVECGGSALHEELVEEIFELGGFEHLALPKLSIVADDVSSNPGKFTVHRHGRISCFQSIDQRIPCAEARRLRVERLAKSLGEGWRSPEEDFAFVREIPEECSLFQARMVRDLSGRGGVVAVCGEEVEGGFLQSFSCVWFPARHEARLHVDDTECYGDVT